MNNCVVAFKVVILELKGKHGKGEWKQTDLLSNNFKHKALE